VRLKIDSNYCRVPKTISGAGPGERATLVEPGTAGAVRRYGHIVTIHIALGRQIQERTVEPQLSIGQVLGLHIGIHRLPRDGIYRRGPLHRTGKLGRFEDGDVITTPRDRLPPQRGRCQYREKHGTPSTRLKDRQRNTGRS
jgi:hypothetical protein